MKPIECFSEEALGEILALPEDDPRRAHVRDCPRCAALALSYEGFMAADNAAAYGPREREALDAAREQLLGSAGAPPVAPERGPWRPAPAGDRPWWSRLLGPALRPAFAFAAVMIAVVGVFVIPRFLGPAPESIVRGLGSQPLSLADPRYERGGAVRLAWRGTPNGETYEVRFFSTALESLGVVPAGPDTTVSIGAERLPAAFARSQTVLYRVTALRGRDEMATSATGALRKP
jgi:hypothetical protein